ncbi:MAG: folylpolyglutamate synthase/dihydrofolate synthase family protein [Candidatus Acidiferrales bacterium]
MNYEESVRALMALGRELAAPQQARVQKFALDNITTLAAALGDPHRSIPCVHIAGTNGKGSTAAMLESILRAAGLRTGLYTSPHLERINERIRIDSESVSDDIFAAAWTRVHATIESLMAAGKLAGHPTFFECVTAMAFLAFAESRVDLAIYEVGLGGRLDATNIIFPEVAIITPVDFDHESYLGHSIEEIAFEKAGIIKKDGCVVSSVSREEARAVIARRAQEMNARMIESDSTWRLENVTRSDGHYRAVAVSVKTKARLAIAPGLPGHFQLRNALAAATAAEILAARGYAVANIAIEQGIARARWPGRLERLARHPDIYLDGAHNPSAARELREFWDEEFANRDIYLVYGAMRDKAVDEIAGILFPRTKAVFLTQPQQPRAISANLLAEMTHGLAPDIYVVRDPTEALERAIQMARPNDAVFVSGSLYLVGELTSYWKSHRRE